MIEVQVNINADNNEVASKADVSRRPTKKIFKQRNSMLTDELQNKHIGGIYNLGIASTIVLVLINVLYEWRDNRMITFGIFELARAFNKIEIGLLAWVFNLSYTFLNFPVFKFWTNTHKRTKCKELIGTIFILLHVTYQIGIQSVAVYTCFAYDLSNAVKFALIIETFRLSMKCYAYVRSNVGRVITGVEYIPPTLCQFVYFMFCPTMLYRDSYPRSAKRDWKIMLKCLLEGLSILYGMSLMNTIFLQRKFMDYGKSDVTLLNIFILWMEIIPAVTILFYFYGFYAFQHSWMNLFAEGLQFADRVFYKDWWNSTSFKEHYRRWSLLVHEWIYEYIYMELYHATKSAIASSLITVIVSAIVHELVLIVVFGFFAPAVLVVYGVIGVMYMYIPLSKRKGNVFFWFNLLIGFPLMALVYIMEYYARINCPAAQTLNVTWSYYYTPMIINCNNIVLNKF